MPNNIAFVFSGQGAQYPGMFKELYETETCVKDVFQCADDSLGRSVSGICFEGTEQELNMTHNTQPCMLAADLAAGMLLRERGIEPGAVAGFSLGEYAALVYAGVLSMEDAFRIVQVRADAMQESVPLGQGAMAAILGASPDDVEALCREVTDDYVSVANYNSPVQTVVAGTNTGVEKVMKIAGDKGLKAIKLSVSIPSHCKLMEPASIVLEKMFPDITFQKPLIPLYMNVTGNVVEQDIPEYLVKQLVNPVRWTTITNNMHQTGIDTFIECGPGRTLSGLIKKTIKGVNICRVENAKTLADTLSKLNI